MKIVNSNEIHPLILNYFEASICNSTNTIENNKRIRMRNMFGNELKTYLGIRMGIEDIGVNKIE